MSRMYKDAKAWLFDKLEDGSMEPGELVGFILGYVTNDDVESYFNINMDSEDDNPGASDIECNECGREYGELNPDDQDSINEHGVCCDCWETDPDNPATSIQAALEAAFTEGLRNPDACLLVDSGEWGYWLTVSDIDYDATEDPERKRAIRFDWEYA